MNNQFENLREKYPGKLLGTHNGKFHLDEVVATAILINLFPEAKLLRSRFIDALNQCDIVYDVGGVFDSGTLRFDHHQRCFNNTFSSEFDVKLSSAGLVYRHFAKKLLEKYEIKPSEETIKEIYEEYFLSIDAGDNGIDNPMKFLQRSLASVVHDFYQPILPEDENILNNFFPDLIIPVQYESENKSLTNPKSDQGDNQKEIRASSNLEDNNVNQKQIIFQNEKHDHNINSNGKLPQEKLRSDLGASQLSEQNKRDDFNGLQNTKYTANTASNGTMKPKSDSKKDLSDQKTPGNVENTKEIAISYSKRFKMALKFIYRDLNNFMRRKESFYHELESGLELFLQCDSSIFFVPVDQNISQDVIFTLSRRYNRNIIFIIYETKSGEFRMYAMRKNPGSFESLCPLKESWGGLRDSELQSISGIETATFVHASGFTGGASNLNDAIRMCEISMEEHRVK